MSGNKGAYNEKQVIIENLLLDHKTYMYLKNAGISNVADIIKTENGTGLMNIKNFGEKQYNDIKSALAVIGIYPDGSPIVIDSVVKSKPETSADETVTISPGQPLAKQDRPLLSTVAFVDYEHWYNALNNLHGRRPNIQAWFDNIKKRGRLVEVTFFGDFSENKGMSKEINYIRQFTSRIIETKNTSEHLKKNFTDFIMLDNIYQKVISSPEIEQIVLVTGDGDFSSVVSYLRNFCDKVVGIYGVDKALSSQIDNSADWCERIPFKDETYIECRIAILKNIKYILDHAKAARFKQTVRSVAEYYNFYEDDVEAELIRMIDEGIIYSATERARWNYKEMINVLKIDWNIIADLELDI